MLLDVRVDRQRLQEASKIIVIELKETIFRESKDSMMTVTQQIANLNKKYKLWSETNE